MSFVVVDTLYEVPLAEFARMKFEAEGIPVLMNSMGQARLFGPAALGGIRVEVPEEFAERAAAILKEVREELDGSKDT
jgi:Putative prokaryotic signal transducing protein